MTTTLVDNDVVDDAFVTTTLADDVVDDVVGNVSDDVVDDVVGDVVVGDIAVDDADGNVCCRQHSLLNGG